MMFLMENKCIFGEDNAIYFTEVFDHELNLVLYHMGIYVELLRNSLSNDF